MPEKDYLLLQCCALMWKIEKCFFMSGYSPQGISKLRKTDRSLDCGSGLILTVQYVRTGQLSDSYSNQILGRTPSESSLVAANCC